KKATAELDKARILVEAGAAPRSSLDQAERALTEAQDDVVISHVLYGKFNIEDLTQEQADQMVAAAGRQLDREKERLEGVRKLIDQGVTARTALAPALEDLQARQKTLDL